MMHVSLDLTVRSRSASSPWPGGLCSPGTMMLTREPMQMERPFRHRPGLYLERLCPLQQSWPDRKARYTAVTAMSNETPRRRHDNWEKASQGAVAGEADTPDAHKRGPHEQKDRIVGSGRGGLGGQTRGCRSVTGLIGSPRFSPDDKQQLPGGGLWYQASASAFCGTTTSEQPVSYVAVIADHKLYVRSQDVDMP